MSTTDGSGAGRGAEDVARWLKSVDPSASKAFVSYLASRDHAEGTEVPSVAEALREVIGALDRAAALGNDREAAFDLLVADALMTDACEAALDGPRPEETLVSLVRRIVGHGTEERDGARGSGG